MVGEGSGAAVLGDGADDRVVEAAPPELRDVLVPRANKRSGQLRRLQHPRSQLSGRRTRSGHHRRTFFSTVVAATKVLAAGARRAGLTASSTSVVSSISRCTESSSADIVPPRAAPRLPRAARASPAGGSQHGIVRRTRGGGFESLGQRVPSIDAAPRIRTCGGRFCAPASPERADVLRWVCLQPPETPRASVRSGSPAAERPGALLLRGEERRSRSEERRSRISRSRESGTTRCSTASRDTGLTRLARGAWGRSRCICGSRSTPR